jgi:hypothetical protein
MSDYGRYCQARGWQIFWKRIPAPAKTNGQNTEWKKEIPAKPRPDGDAYEVRL